MRKIFTILTVTFALNISAKDYVMVAQPIVAYATNGNTSTTLLALPAMIANTDEATFVMGNVLPGEVINTTDIETIQASCQLTLRTNGRNLEITSNEQQQALVSVYDCTGRKVQQATLQNGRATLTFAQLQQVLILLLFPRRGVIYHVPKIPKTS